MEKTEAYAEAALRRSKTKQYKEGWSCGLNNIDTTACPYKSYTESNDLWWEGFKIGRHMRLNHHRAS